MKSSGSAAITHVFAEGSSDCYFGLPDDEVYHHYSISAKTFDKANQRYSATQLRFSLIALKWLIIPK